MLRRPSFVVLSLLLLGAPAASAQTLPSAALTVDVFFNLSPPNRISTNVFGSYPLSDPRFGSILVGAAGVPAPALSADATIGPNALASIFGRGAATLQHAIEVIGPAGSVGVLVGARGEAAGTASAGASFAVESAWRLFDGASQIAGHDVASGQIFGQGFDQSFADSVGVVLATNHLYLVSMVADAAAAATEAGSRATASAFVDPLFSFASGVDPTLYAFRFSDGIGNVAAAVPEPGIAALLTVGLVALARTRRRVGSVLPESKVGSGGRARMAFR